MATKVDYFLNLAEQTARKASGTHYTVQVSDDFMYRARGQQTSKLSRYMPFQSFALSRREDKKLYATISADVDRTKPLRTVKPRKKEQAL